MSPYLNAALAYPVLLRIGWPCAASVRITAAVRVSTPLEDAMMLARRYSDASRVQAVAERLLGELSKPEGS